MGRREQMRGSSLPEVLVASALLVLLLAPVVGLFGAARFTSMDSGRKSAAVNVARTWLERFLAMDWTTMDRYLADPANQFVAVDPGVRWERAFSPDPDQPQFDVQVVVQARQIRAPDERDVMPDQLTLRDITVTVRWFQKSSTFTVQQATTMHKR